MFQDDTTGLRFGNFEVLVRPDGSIHELGRGGYGRTLLARHALLNTRVALKIIDERHALDEAARARFLKEAREQARLIHPGIARITDCGQVDGQLYYAVELCPGGHLKEFVAKAGPLSVADTFHLMLQAADALDYSHRNGVIHHDVKPSNLMLVLDGEGRPQVKLIDFGLVQPVSGETPGSTDGSPLFSVPFASPEQIRSGPADGRSDFFSLGMSAWFLLTGHHPVEGPADAVIEERLSSAEYESALPPQLRDRPREILARMIRKNPADRYAAGTDLLRDLRACVQTMPRLAGGWQHRRRSSGTLAERFTLEKAIQARTGTVHFATDRTTRQRVKVTLLRPAGVMQTVAQYHRVRDLMSSMEGSGLLRVLEVHEFDEGWAVIEEASAGTSLTEILRTEGALPLARCAPLIWQLGTAMDTAFDAGLTNVMLDETMVDQPPGGARKTGIDWSAAIVRLPLAPGAPGTLSAPEQDVTLGDFTRTGVSGAGVQLLARWVYFIVGGKNPAPSSLFSLTEYIAIPGLGDQGNQILARHLCGQSAPARCGDFLKQLFFAEGISWDGVGERVRQARWGAVLQDAGDVLEEIESTATIAETLSASCEPFAAFMPAEVKRCATEITAVSRALTDARALHAQLSQPGNRSPDTGRTVIASLKEIAARAAAALQQARTAAGEAKAGGERLRKEADHRERRRGEITGALFDSWKRTQTAAGEARDMAEQCRQAAPSSGAARQMESLAGQTAALAGQLETLYKDAAAAPESEWERFEKQITQARQIAIDAGEMARTCRSLLERAKTEATRKLEDEKRRMMAAGALQTALAQLRFAAAPAGGIAAEMQKLAAELPGLATAAERTTADHTRLAAIVDDLARRAADEDAALADIERCHQDAITGVDDVSGLVRSMQTALHQARKTATELRSHSQAWDAMAAEVQDLVGATGERVAVMESRVARHEPSPAAGTPAADCLSRAQHAITDAHSVQAKLISLAAGLGTPGSGEAAAIGGEARRLATECERHLSEASTRLQDAEYYTAEAIRQTREEEGHLRAHHASLIQSALEQADREIHRARVALGEAAPSADVPEAVAAAAKAKAVWEDIQTREARILEWQHQRPAEAATDADFHRLLSTEVEALAHLSGEAAHLSAEITAAVHRHQENLQHAAEEKARAEEAERHIREEALHREAEAATAQKQLEEEQARLKVEAEEARLAAELAAQSEQRRLAEEEAACRREVEEARLAAEQAEQRRLAEEEAARLREAEEEACQAAAQAEQQRLAEEAAHRRQMEEARLAAEQAEARRLAEEEAARYEAAAAERRRQAEESARLYQEAAAHRAAEEQARARHTAALFQAPNQDHPAVLLSAATATPAAKRKSNTGAVVAIAAILAAGGAFAVWKFTGSEPAPTPGPNPGGSTPASSNNLANSGGSDTPVTPPVTSSDETKPTGQDPPLVPTTSGTPDGGVFTSTITLTGDIMTKGVVSAKDITVSGIDAPKVTTEGNAITLKFPQKTGPFTVKLASARHGLKLSPDELEIQPEFTAHTVDVVRETGTATATPSPKAASFYNRVIFQWAGDPGFSPPPSTEEVLDLASAASIELPTGKWKMSLDDEAPGENERASCGMIVDRREAGVITVEPGGTADPALLPPGLPPLLFSRMEWITATGSGDETAGNEKKLLTLLSDSNGPPGNAALKTAVRGLAQTAALPKHSWPLYLIRRDGPLYILQPQRQEFLNLLNLGIIRIAGAAAVTKVVSPRASLAGFNPAAGAGPQDRISWFKVDECLVKARTEIAGVNNPNVKKLYKDAGSSLNVLRMALHDDWTIEGPDVALYTNTWLPAEEPATDVHVKADGSVSLIFRTGDTSVRALLITPDGPDRYLASVPPGTGEDETDTLSGTFLPVTRLPAPLASKAPPE